MVISYLLLISMIQLEKLSLISDHYNPKKIISLGDSFHESDTLNIISETHIIH